MKEYDRLGPERFFSQYGFAPTTTYLGRTPLSAESNPLLGSSNYRRQSADF
jgi:hypothetical protein